MKRTYVKYTGGRGGGKVSSGSLPWLNFHMEGGIKNLIIYHCKWKNTLEG